MTDIPTLITSRLTMRPIHRNDLDAYAAMWSDPEFTRHIGGPRDLHDTWHNMAANLGCWALEGIGLWSVVETSSGELVGRAGLWTEPGWPGVEAAWFIGRPWWGRGFATEAGRTAITWAFDHLDLDRVVSVIRSDNTRSIRVAEKLGLAPWHTEHLHGADKLVYAVSRAAFRPG